MKILYVTTIGSTMNFFNSFIKQLLDEGNTVEIATNESVKTVPDCYRDWNCVVHQISTSRSPFCQGNLKAIKQLKQLVRNEQYDIVHCHTPVAAMCTRLACKSLRKQGTKVMYTAHGFHFYKGAPLKNWLMYFPVEWFLAHYTDVLITINKEDYARAQKFAAKKVYYVPGVGIDTLKFAMNEETKRAKKEQIRNELNIPLDAPVLLSVGEVNENKNHRVVIEALEKLEIKNAHYIICGRGELDESHKALAKRLGLEKRIHLVGYRTDVADFYQCADVFVFPSLREGLPVAVMEAMASGLPIACSRIRGNIDLFDDHGKGMFDPHNVYDCGVVIKEMLSSDLGKMKKYNLEKVKDLSQKKVIKLMSTIYADVAVSKH